MDREWVSSTGLRLRMLPEAVRPSGHQYQIYDKHPEKLRYRNGSIEFRTIMLASTEWAWIATKARGEEFIVIFRQSSRNKLWEVKKGGFRPESLAAEKVLLRLVREGFGRVV